MQQLRVLEALGTRPEDRVSMKMLEATSNDDAQANPEAFSITVARSAFFLWGAPLPHSA